MAFLAFLASWRFFKKGLAVKIFRDRTEAGKLLAEKLSSYADLKNAMVLALPRGGVPVGFEISKKLHLPLDAFLVRKIGAPWHEELALGAIAMGGVKVFNQDILEQHSSFAG